MDEVLTVLLIIVGMALAFAGGLVGLVILGIHIAENAGKWYHGEKCNICDKRMWDWQKRFTHLKHYRCWRFVREEA